MVIRTTFIAGISGETEEEFNQMAEFSVISVLTVWDVCLFAEEDTPAALMPNQIDEDVKQSSCTNHDGRTNGYYAAIGTAAKSGTVMEILVEGYDEYSGCYYGRSYADSPDIDGKVLFTAW